MVWFQCEDCGENLKKPKLANHFRMCSAFKLSCIDCGKMFDQQTVQGHTQCISEAEKYGPKDQAKSPHTQIVKSKPKTDVDVNVGLSSRYPWKCSLCNTTTTSMQTLLGHADGKKHRAKARAYHASQNNDSAPTTISAASVTVPAAAVEVENGDRKRKQSKTGNVNGEVIQAVLKKLKSQEEEPRKKIKWKKIVASILEESPNGILKIKKLQKLVRKEIKKYSGTDEDKAGIQNKLMEKIASSSKFAIESKSVRLVL
ncbi:putative Cell growth-regulating nucleolar protein [Zostera marina]|uniref:Putative Cell growth-regulating nucleolar protein n=1 Tax=Zostera marina TaxID=29655 RepID=A0A0K9PEF9_ZOSMR|nr:putative Cell growth-regulating nucleolar protein [Zostera marina]